MLNQLSHPRTPKRDSLTKSTTEGGGKESQTEIRLLGMVQTKPERGVMIRMYKQGWYNSSNDNILMKTVGLFWGSCHIRVGCKMNGR